uniref:Uncharacterized protein n=1 Tax=Aureoumbra lagunensis TaxID=44058 RepID=A0A7S3NN00_9STRA|mmetsp:Transcript_4885/g.6913  ORF Transcript_4885/g.6913 Transcript_4885/m.6913 type:complete len:254 (-) Transcript_4885:77-838(-)|eukprot:CAMPEP_0197296074 /NCGR_PEP_ID=MMETSP0890-20130614/37392_1 /TAXON_ID=44058 ORGANISM="Aureoumbra lagunensis, Strain CCMP1510" /NCGR_SAMPLE_ID=MMETSP0890 /ASSEMBLY_ACC=CAM_ASM_000533 /LENGTH=253 /DNA_ID=CAMNT_0042772403 /DNA_START=39 /DNA_END=800 /DNA_ORIENTATION=-
MKEKEILFFLIIIQCASPFFIQPKNSKSVLRGCEFEAEVCTASEAALLVGETLVAEAPQSIWVKATQVNGTRSAVARLRFDSKAIDGLRLNFPKEEWENARLALGSCVDKLIATWLLDGNHEYEELGAATDAHSAYMFEIRGFFELQCPDLTAIASGKPIVTHRARLAPAIFAFQLLESSPDTQTILKALRNQPVPSSASPQLADGDSTNLLLLERRQGGKTIASKEDHHSTTLNASSQLDNDPWSGLGRTFF